MPCNYKDYPPNWKEIRERILFRSGNRCEKCGLQNHLIIRKDDRKTPGAQEWDIYNDLIRRQYNKVYAMRVMRFTEIVLTIAHLDHDKDNWNVADERLAAWCQKCHLGHDIQHHITNRKYGKNYKKNQFKLW